ncbi:MAG: hypothetical protein DRN95_08370 [Candidatus Hydrothermarchaeota archaeon]|nr:MAG: hypothetical protein DRN95_08370 [Candidatus Hydrothermarchaeota archaeon]
MQKPKIKRFIMLIFLFILTFLASGMIYINDWTGISNCVTEKEIVMARSIGFRLSRTGIPWAGIEIKYWNKHWFWEEPDNLVLQHKNRHIDILYVLAFTPWWASSGGDYKSPFQSNDYMYYPPKDIKDWENFIRKIAIRYKGLIKMWEIWNEPDTEFFWRGSVEEYKELVESAYKTLKEVDSESTVVLGGLALSDPGDGKFNPDFLEEFLKLGGGNFIDVISFHIYCNQKETLKDKVRYIKRLFKRYNINKKIWITELGCSTATHTEEEQSEFIMKSLKESSELGIEKVFIYRLEDIEEDEEWESRLGILRRDFSYKKIIYKLWNFLHSGIID